MIHWLRIEEYRRCIRHTHAVVSDALKYTRLRIALGKTHTPSQTHFYSGQTKEPQHSPNVYAQFCQINAHVTYLAAISSPSKTGTVYLPPSQSALRSSMLRARNNDTFKKNEGTTSTAKLQKNTHGDHGSSSTPLPPANALSGVCRSTANMGRNRLVADDAPNSPRPL